MKKYSAKKRRSLAVIFAAAAVLMIIFCFAYITVFGQRFTMEIETNNGSAKAENFEITTENEEKILKCIKKEVIGTKLHLTFESVSEGSEFIQVEGLDDFSYCDVLYVHKNGIITVNTFFGNCTGALIIPICVSIYLALLLFGTIKSYIIELKRNLYQYKNAGELGIIIYLAVLFARQLLFLFNYNGFIETIRSILMSANHLAIIAFPIAFILSILVTISNIQLLRKEGKSLKNLLATALGLLICIGTVFPFVLSEYLQRSDIVDLHNMSGTAMYVEMAVTAMIYAIVSYLECILIGMIAVSVKAARHIPRYDKDFIIILGCQINEDGTLTKLLQGRADRAVWFADKQKSETGKDIIFVPSGGQGSDEVISEGEAIENYLLSIGIDKNRIISEKRSVNTYENIRNSMELIKERGLTEPKIAFSTTNYHVFRSGVIAANQGFKLDGIGSNTKSYFWINAFIREFIAALYYERKKHIAIIGLISAAVLIMTGIEYYANQL